MVDALRSRYLPRLSLIRVSPGVREEMGFLAPFVNEMVPVDRSTTAYVCTW